MEAEELLKDSLNNRTPILFLGAGFSFKALNHRNKTIELAIILRKRYLKNFI